MHIKIHLATAHFRGLPTYFSSYSHHQDKEADNPDTALVEQNITRPALGSVGRLMGPVKIIGGNFILSSSTLYPASEPQPCMTQLQPPTTAVT